MNQWRWTVTDSSRPIVRQESGQNINLHDAMIEIEKTVRSMMESKQN
jgi:hypothetical protein